jgi:hypothetical protein
MKKMFTSIVAMGATAMLLSSCQKDVQPATHSTLSQSTLSQASTKHSANTSDYGPGAKYEIELSANIPSSQGGGVWLWIALYPNWEGDYAGSDCGHGGGGAASDKGDVTWHYAGTNNEWVVINGVVLNGLGGFPTTITVPAKYGHYKGTVGSYLTLPSFIPPSIGFTQLQVAP